MKAAAAGLSVDALRDGNRAAVGDFVAKHRQYLTGKVLDFGCGPQPYKHLVDGEYVPFDPDYGRKPAEPTGVYDAILITQVLQFVENPAETLRRLMADHLKVGGHFVITYHTSWYEAQAADTWRISTRGMERLLAGCEIVAHEAITELLFDNFTMRLTSGVVARRAA